jgi:hypothetical protein
MGEISIRDLESSPMGRIGLVVDRRDPASAVLALLIAHYDESGTHDGSPITVISGLAGSAEAWVAFEREWNKILKKNGISFVHAKDMHHRHRQHKGWSRRRIRELWADATYVIQEQNLFMSRIILFNDDYDNLYRRKEDHCRKPLDSRYGLCFRILALQLPYLYGMRYFDCETHFVMESGHKNAGDAVRIFDQIKSYNLPNKVGSLTFVGKNGSPGVQAADLLAYDAFQFLRPKIKSCDDEYDEENEIYYEDFMRGIGETEQELVDAGMPVVEHTITPDNLVDMRMLALQGVEYFKRNQASKFMARILNQTDFSGRLPVFEKRWSE